MLNLKINHKSIILLAIPLVLSAFTHLWNLDGFPSIYRDEEHYMRKALHVMNGSGPQEGPDDPLSYRAHPYTHPYFGQIFLAVVLGMIGYPDSLNLSQISNQLKHYMGFQGYRLDYLLLLIPFSCIKYHNAFTVGMLH